MNFHQFAQCVALETITRRKGALKPDPHLGTLKCHLLKEEHPLSETHVLVEHTNDERGDGSSQLVPRAVGTYIPRERHGKRWKLFALAHFKPFSNVIPFIQPGMTLEHTFKNFTFSPHRREIMDNWEVVHECQDKRDAERLWKRAALTAQSLTLTKSLSKALNLLDADEVDVSPKNNRSAVTKFKILQTIRILEQSNWLTSASSSMNASKANAFTHPLGTIDEEIPEPSTHTLKHWMQDIKWQESLIAHACRNVQESLQDTPSMAAETEQGLTLQAMYNNEKDQCLPTDAMAVNKANDILSAEDVINKVGNNFKLNEKQWMAFRIIAQSFVWRYVEGVEWDAEPLRMLMTGPGRTGKTHIVKAVQQVMDHYGCAHKI